MQDDVNKVVAAILAVMKRPNGIDNALTDDVARAAMSATREIDAEALLKIAARHKRHGRPQASSEAKDNANWLQQRANDVKGCDNG